MICIKCRHEQCPICLDWCDEVVQDEDGEWGPCSCFEMNCVYEENK